MKKKVVFNVTFTAVMIGLAVAFDFVAGLIPFLKFPYGGCISFAMLPLVLISIMCGPVYGIIGGSLFGLINYFIDGYGFNIISFLLDYIVAFATLAIISVFRKKILEGKKGYFVLGFALGLNLRWISSSISGVLNAASFGIDGPFLESIFGNGKTSLLYICIYSFILYNMPYIFASGVLCIVLGLIMYNSVIMRKNGENE
ncbi:MAG: energy-coupled thiamine transporter ThiT [Bacilli bacterium]|nr:energy-coupled thiamine transporter ThiT [Bacilli bacterium]